MPYVKVPGIDREIWIALHEPDGDELPWFVLAGTEVNMKPQQIAEEMADSKSPWDFSYSHEFSRGGSDTEADAMKVAAREFEIVRRKIFAAKKGVGSSGRGRGGRPSATNFSVAEDVSVIATHFIWHGLKRGAAITAALDYWIDGKVRRKEPAKRLIDAAMARIRRGGIAGLAMSVAAVRAKYFLPVLPSMAPPPGKLYGRIE